MLEHVEHAVPLARALVQGGVRVLEVTLRTKAALACIEAIARDGSWRKSALQVVGPGYYFSESPAPASHIKISPDARHALVLHSQQLYLVTLPAPDATAVPIDLSRTGASVQRAGSIS